MATKKLSINRAPVLTLWAVVVAERLGYKPAEALTIAKALTGLIAHAHGRALGIFTPSAKAKSEEKKVKVFALEFLGRQIPAVKTKEGVRAVSKDEPIKPEGVERYLQSKFGEALPEARAAFEVLAKSLPPKELSARAYSLYGRFSPKVPKGTAGWGAKGELDLELVHTMAAESRKEVK